MIDEGHCLGNHGMKHLKMSEISETELNEEIMSLHNLVLDKYGYEMQYLRPPCGEFSESSLKTIQNAGYKTIMWSFAYVDWNADNQPTHDEAFSKLIPRIHPGAIVLLHNTSKTNGEILDELLTKWEEMGYSFKTLEEF